MKPNNARPISDIEVAEQCEFLVRQPDVGFEPAWALALAAQRVRELNYQVQKLRDRLLLLSHRNEQLEGDAALLFHQLYGPQRGGAA
jgi:threonine dehydratase